MLMCTNSLEIAVEPNVAICDVLGLGKANQRTFRHRIDRDNWALRFRASTRLDIIRGELVPVFWPKLLVPNSRTKIEYRNAASRRPPRCRTQPHAGWTGPVSPDQREGFIPATRNVMVGYRVILHRLGQSTRISSQ